MIKEAIGRTFEVNWLPTPGQTCCGRFSTSLTHLCDRVEKRLGTSHAAAGVRSGAGEAPNFAGPYGHRFRLVIQSRSGIELGLRSR